MSYARFGAARSSATILPATCNTSTCIQGLAEVFVSNVADVAADSLELPMSAGASHLGDAVVDLWRNRQPDLFLSVCAIRADGPRSHLQILYQSIRMTFKRDIRVFDLAPVGHLVVDGTTS